MNLRPSPSRDDTLPGCATLRYKALINGRRTRHLHTQWHSINSFEPVRASTLKCRLRHSVSLISPYRRSEPKMVRTRRFELPRNFFHNDLNVARLPISPRPQTRRPPGFRRDQNGGALGGARTLNAWYLKPVRIPNSATSAWNSSFWCGQKDSNLHALRPLRLRQRCLPISTYPQNGLRNPVPDSNRRARAT